MPPGTAEPGDSSRPGPRKPARLPLLVLSLSLPLFIFLFIPNPLMDAALAQAVRGVTGVPVALHSARLTFQPAKAQILARVRRMDIRTPEEGAELGAAGLLRRSGLPERLSIRESRWLFRYKNGAWYVRLLDAAAGDSALRAGARFDGGRLSRLNAAFWLAEDLGGRFPDLAQKRFSTDRDGRRRLKLTWNNGRWVLWGRGAPVLEARWR